jgi:hypothetical protein
MMPTQAPSGKFYDASINGGFNCRDGVTGTDGGPYGTVKVDTSTDTAEIRVSRLSSNTAYEVFLNVTGPGGCGEQHLATLTTNTAGKGSVSVSTSSFPPDSGVFFLNAGSAPDYATPFITF